MLLTALPAASTIEVGGLVGFQPRPHLFGRRDRRRVDFCGAFLQVVGGDQLRFRHLSEIRVAEVVGAIGEHALFDFRQQVNIARRVQRHALEVGGAIFFIPSSCASAMPPELGRGAVYTVLPRQLMRIGSRHFTR